MKSLPLTTTGPAARLLGITPQGVIDLVKRGKLTAFRTEGGQRLFRLRDVERLRAAREQQRQQREAVTA